MSDNSSIEIFIDNNKSEFEKYVILNMWKNPQFYFKYAPTINSVYNYSSKNDNVCKDFTNSTDNAIYDCLVWYYQPLKALYDLGIENTPIPIAPREYFIGIIDSQIKQDRRLDHYRQTLAQRLSELKDLPAEPFTPIVHSGLELWLKSQRVKKAGLELQKTHVDAAAFLEKMQETVEKATLTKTTSCVKGFEMDPELQQEKLTEEELARGKTYPCSIQGVNKAMGGGFAKGEATMIFAPENCGKTVLATQLARDFAEQKLNVAFVTTEQGQDELYPRFITNYCNIEFDKIKNGVNVKNLTDDKKKSLRQWHETIGQRTRIIEWNKNAMDAKSLLRPTLNDLKKDNFEVDVLIYDWLGGGLGDLSKEELKIKREIYQSHADELCYVSRDYNIIVIFLMQAAVGSCLNIPVLNQSHLGECKTAGQRATWGIAISGIQESTGGAKNTRFGNKSQTWKTNQILHFFKCRKATGGVVDVARDFGYQRFKDLEAGPTKQPNDNEGNQLRKR